MRIILKGITEPGQVFLDDGTEITKGLRVNVIEVRGRLGDPIRVILEVYPSELLIELPDGEIALKKHPSRIKPKE